MFRSLSFFVVIMLGYCLIAEGVGRSHADRLSRLDLKVCNGGTQQYCVDPFRTFANECPTCLASMSYLGLYETCSTTTQDKYLLYHAGQSPAQSWDLSNNSCGGDLIYWSDSGCTSLNWTDTGACGRTVNQATGPSFPVGVNCP